MMRIGIIGAGMAGIRLLYEYIHNTKDVDVVIFDDPHMAGRGGPFVHDHSSLLLNQPQDQMSLEGSNDGYICWLKDNLPDQVEKRFTSRSDFGKYAEWVFQQYCQEPRVTFIPHVIEAVKKDGDRFVLTDDDEKNHHFDGIHVACGPLPYQDPYELKGKPGYHGKPYPLSQLWGTLKEETSIGIIGQGLAAVDVAVFLEAQEYDGRQVYFSNTGYFPTIRGEDIDVTFDAIPKVLQSRSGKLDAMIEAIEKDAKRNGISIGMLKPQKEMDGQDYLEYQLEHAKEFAIGQQVVFEYNKNYPYFWNQMLRSDQMTYAKEYGDLFTLLQSPMPKESAMKILESYKAGKTVSYNDVKEVKPTDAGFVLQRGDAHLRVPRLINATGVGDLHKPMAYDSDAKTVLFSLYDQFLIETHLAGGFMVHYPDLSAVSHRHGIIRNLKLHGSQAEGVVFANNAIETLGIEAEMAMKDMMEYLKKS